MKECRIYAEGGGNSGLLRRTFAEHAQTLFRKCGFAGRMPKVIPCGTRNAAYDKFKTAHESGEYGFVALLVDSEDAVTDGEQPWAHLLKRDNWTRPTNADDEQVFLMTTCMETWLIADRPALQQHYGSKLQANALPTLTDLEARHRHEVQDALERATSRCTNAYQKNKRAFALLAAVTPAELEKHLPAFARMTRILRERL